MSTFCDPPGGPTTSGVMIPPGGSAWVSVSDSTAKHNIRPVSGAEVLDKLAQLPIHRWNYKSQVNGADHIGPMAQDFYRLFQLGEDDKHISTLDPDGIALAAAKELYAQNQKQQTEIETLKSQLAGQTEALGALETKLSALESALQTVLAGASGQGDLTLSAVTEPAEAVRR